MPDNTLSVKITADVAELQTKFAVARAEVNALNSQLNKLARDAAKSGVDDVLKTQMNTVSTSLLQAKANMSEVASQADKMGVSVGKSGEMSSLGISRTVSAVRSLGEAFRTGNLSELPIALTHIGHSALELNPMALVGLAGVSALAAGLAYLATKAIEAQHALDEIHIGAEFAGNLELSRAKIKEFADDMSSATNISGSDALKIAGSFARMHDMSAAEMQGLSQLVADFASATGKSSTEAGQEIAKLFSTSESAEALARSLGNVTQDQINAAHAADMTGNSHVIASEKIKLLDDALKIARPDIDEHNRGLFASIGNFLMYAGAAAAGGNADEIDTIMLAAQNRERQKQIGLLQQAASELKDKPISPQQRLQTGTAVAEKENTTADQIEQAKTKVTQLVDALQVAKTMGDQVSVDKLNAALDKAREQLSALQFGPAIEKMRSDMAQVAATWDGTQSGMLEKQRQIAAKTLESVKGNVKEEIAARQEIAQLDAQIRRSSGEEAIASTHEQMAEINAQANVGALQRLQQEKVSLDQLLASHKLNAAQIVQVKKELAQNIAAINRESLSEQTQIEAINTNTQIAISRLQIEAKKAALDVELQDNKITADQKYAILQDLTTREFALDRQAKEDQLKLLNQQPVEQARVNGELKVLWEKYYEDLAKLDQQRAAEQHKAQADEVKGWKSAVGEITNAETSFLADYLTGRKTAGQSVVALGQQLALKEIQNDAAAITTRLLLANTAEAQKKALETGGLLYHAVVESGKTTTTTTNSAIRTAAGAAENTTFLGRLGATLAGWLGLETGKTAGTVTGTATRAAAEAAGEATGLATSVAAGFAQISIDAAVAAAGAMAATAAIPIIGPEIAPAVAAATYAETIGWAAGMGGGIALATGAWEIPDTMQATLHKGEAVVTAQDAPAIRSWASGKADGGNGGAGAGQGLHVGGDLNVTMSSPGGAMNENAVVAALLGAARRGNPAIRRAFS